MQKIYPSLFKESLNCNVETSVYPIDDLHMFVCDKFKLSEIEKWKVRRVMCLIKIWKWFIIEGN